MTFHDDLSQAWHIHRQDLATDGDHLGLEGGVVVALGDHAALDAVLLELQ